MAQAPRDENFVPATLLVGSDGETFAWEGDETTGRAYVDIAGGSGTVTSVSVVTANGFAGSVADPTTTPAITLSTTVTGIVKGNGTALSAASAGTDYVAPGAITTSGLTVATDRLLGRDTTGTGAIEEITIGSGLQLTGGALSTTGGTGIVETVVGTANRITVNSTDPANPVVDIASTYVGQNTITTLGTVTTGTLSTGAVIAGVTMTLGSDATGDIYYRNAGGVLTRLGIGSSTNVLTVSGGLPAWAAPAAAGTITVANEATDTSCFPVFVTAATGDLAPKSNTGLTFNSNTASLGATLMTATTSLTTATVRASSNDSGSLGASGTAFSDLFLASGAVIDFAAGNSVITHSSAVLTVSTGDLRVTNAGTNSASVVTVGGTQTLTNKTLTSPTITTATLSGAQTLAEGASIALDPSLSADGAYSGITISGTAGATLAFGDLIYLAAADSRWELVDADSTSTSALVMVGMCVLAAAADGDPTTILLFGNIRADAAFPTFTISAPIFASGTAGDVTQTAPTGTDSVTMVLGKAITADSMLFISPMDWITHT